MPTLLLVGMRLPVGYLACMVRSQGPWYHTAINSPVAGSYILDAVPHLVQHRASCRHYTTATTASNRQAIFGRINLGSPLMPWLLVFTYWRSADDNERTAFPFGRVVLTPRVLGIFGNPCSFLTLRCWGANEANNANKATAATVRPARRYVSAPCPAHAGTATPRPQIRQFPLLWVTGERLVGDRALEYGVRSLPT